MKLNFMGDLVIQHPESIRIGEKLRDCLDHSNYNIINFEVPVREGKEIPESRSGPNICQFADNQSWLSQNNFHILAMANDHIMDYGTQWLKNTLSCLKNYKHIGVGNWEEAYRPLIIEEGNLKVALFSMAELQFGILQDEDDRDKQGCAWIMVGYNNLFSMGGYIHIDRMLIKSILRYLLGRCNSLHALNNLQCEFHHWTICRAIRNQKGLN